MAGLGIGLGYQGSSSRSSTHAPFYKPRVRSIESAERLLLGDILNLYGGSPFGAADLTFGAQQQPWSPQSRLFLPQGPGREGFLAKLAKQGPRKNHPTLSEAMLNG